MHPCGSSVSPWQPAAMRIAAVRQEIAEVATYDLQFVDVRDAAAYRFQPGQFNMLYLPGVGEAAISLSGDAGETTRWQHTVRIAGRVTTTLAQLPVGAVLGVRGPFGQGWPVDAWRGSDVVLVAGGIGLAPVRPILYELLRRRSEFGNVTLIYGARTPETLLYRDEYAAWESGGIRVLSTVDRAPADWSGHQGVVTLLLDRLPLPRPDRTYIAACGPEVMMRYTAMSAARRGITNAHLWLSMERNMQCAAGFCGHCQWGPLFVCKDGPVFRLDRIQHLLTVEAL